MDLRALGELLVALADLDSVRAQLTGHESRLWDLETRMATQQEVLARIDTFTTALGTDVTEIAQQMRDLRAAITTGSAAAVDAAMEAFVPAIDRMDVIGQQLHAVASSPGSPVPGEAQ